MLLRTLYLSLDPYMRQVMNEVAPVYAASVRLGQPMPGGGAVNRVVASRHPAFRADDLVLGNAGWQEFAPSDGSGLLSLGKMGRPSLALGALGMPGFTAHVGLLDIGQPQPGETVVVAAATGAVGANVGQIAKLKGARVVGIAGGADKCRYAVEGLGFDACLDRRDPPVPSPLPRLPATVLQKRIRMQGFIILDHYGDRFDAFRREMGEWIAARRVKVRETLVEGLENAPAAFIGLLEGRNFGKLVVLV